DLPERPSELLARLEREHGLGPEVTRQLVYAGLVERFEELTRRGRGAAPVARLLTQELPAAVAESGEAFAPSDDVLDELLRAAESGRISKEGIPPVLRNLASGAPSVDRAVAASGLVGLSAEELRALVDRIVRGQAELVRARGSEAFSPLMGDVMREVRGRRDGQEVARELRAAIERLRALPT
ncbi:MAG TPA: hypothetical protein VML53_03670, partial [Thermoplasmata archaeon]|nr:hypothetical protein [Thermoplasmata archaeon]